MIKCCFPCNKIMCACVLAQCVCANIYRCVYHLLSNGRSPGSMCVLSRPMRNRTRLKNCREGRVSKGRGSAG